MQSHNPRAIFISQLKSASVTEKPKVKCAKPRVSGVIPYGSATTTELAFSLENPGQASFERLMVFAKTSGYVSLVNVARQSKLLYLQNETAPANYQSEGVQFPRHSDISTEHNLMLSEMNLTANPPACRANDGLLRYLNSQKAIPETGSFQPQLAGLSGARGRRRILTESTWSVPDPSRQGSEI